MQHHTRKTNKFLSFVRKNASMLSGLTAIVLTLLFLATVIISGKSNQLTALSKIGAAEPTLTFQEATCSSVIISANAALAGNLTLSVLNSREQVVSQSQVFSLPFANETSLVRYPQLTTSDSFFYVLRLNGQLIGQSQLRTFNMVCPPPQIYFTQHTCNSVDVASSTLLGGQFQVAVLFGSGEEGVPSRVVSLSQPFSFNQYNAHVTFPQRLTSNDDFIYVLYRNGAFIGTDGGGAVRSLECYVPPTPSPTPNHPPVGNLESITLTTTTATAKGWAKDPDSTAPIIVQFFLDNPKDSATISYIGSATADQPRADLPYADKNHGFTFPLSKVLQDNKPHKLYAYAVDTAVGTVTPQLTGSSLAFTWNVPTPSPTPTRSPSPTPTRSPSPTPSPTPIAYGCNNQSFYGVSGLGYTWAKDCLTVPREMYLNDPRFTMFVTPSKVANIPFIKTENLGIKEDKNLNWTVNMNAPSLVYVFYRKIPGQTAPAWLRNNFTKLTDDNYSNLNQFLLRKNEQGLIGVYDIYEKAPLFLLSGNESRGSVTLGPASDSSVTAYSMYLVGIKPLQ